MVDDDGIAFELNLVLVASRALDVAAAIRVRVVRLFNPLRCSLQGGLGLDQLGLGVGDGLIGVG